MECDVALSGESDETLPRENDGEEGPGLADGTKAKKLRCIRAVGNIEIRDSPTSQADKMSTPCLVHPRTSSTLALSGGSSKNDR